jgi:nicotinamide-nucleotide amidase
MNAEILATGEEIRTGTLVDSNSAYIAARLDEAGVKVVRIQAVGDDLEELGAVLLEIAARADLAVVTGGLGPTADDLSAAAAAAAAGVELRLSPEALTSIEEFFKKRNRPMSATSRKQAMLPAGAEVLANTVGTAPGFGISLGRCRFFFLPGVPFEMRHLLEAQVLPRLSAALGDCREYRPVRTLSVFGMTESITGERLAGVEAHFPAVKLGLRAAFPEIQVKLYACAPDPGRARQQLDGAAAWVRERLGDVLFSDAGEPMAAVVGGLLRARGASLALAESCTGGLIAHRLTEIPGSSDYFRAALVTYADETKIRILGVAPQTLVDYGAVHPETAREMAAGARRLAGATYGLATSGIAGPGGGSSEKPVGTVCIGLATPAGARGFRFEFHGHARVLNKQLFAMKAMDLLRRELLGLPQ